MCLCLIGNKWGVCVCFRWIDPLSVTTAFHILPKKQFYTPVISLKTKLLFIWHLIFLRLFKAGRKVINSGALSWPKMSTHDCGEPWHQTFVGVETTSCRSQSWTTGLLSFTAAWSRLWLHHPRVSFLLVGRIVTEVRGSDANPVCLPDALPYTYLFEIIYSTSVLLFRVKEGGVRVELQIPVGVLCCVHIVRVGDSSVPVGGCRDLFSLCFKGCGYSMNVVH